MPATVYTFDPNDAAQLDLVQRVEARLDEITPTSQTPSVKYSRIYDELAEEAQVLLRRMPKQVVYKASVLYAPTYSDTASVGTGLRIALPADYIRFLRIQLTAWTRPVDSLISVDSDMYRAQYNPHQCANPSQPLAAIIPHIDGDSTEALHCFPAPTAATGLDTAPDVRVSELLIVQRTAPEAMPEHFRDALVWGAAYRILVSLKDGASSERAKVAAEEVKRGLLVGMRGEEMPQREVA